MLVYKVLEWTGFIIVILSVLANGQIRHNGGPDFLEYITIIFIFVGFFITLIGLILRKIKEKKEKQ
jgi:hypothetical protein